MNVETAIQQQAQEHDFDPNDLGDVDVPDVPSGLSGNVPNFRGGSAKGGKGTTESTQHPDLQRYNTLVNVENDDG